MPSEIERGIFETVRWFDLFDRPVTVLELVERMVGFSGRVSLRQVREALSDSEWLSERVEFRDGLVFLQGRENLVEERLQREARAQLKWKLVRGVQIWLAMVPFVRALAGSGSLAINNTKKSSDLDVFVIAAPGRIWLARLGLLLVAEMSGRRRQYWHAESPNGLCLNHYVSEDALEIAPEIRNVYTAMLYTGMVPLYGESVVREFWSVNWGWMSEYVGWRERPAGMHVYTRELPRWLQGLKLGVEAVLAEPAWDWLEDLARAVQMWVIHRHERIGQAGRVVTGEGELAFHPDTKVPALLARFEGRA